MRAHSTATKTMTGVLALTALLALFLWGMQHVSPNSFPTNNQSMAVIERTVKSIGADPIVLVEAPVAWLREHHQRAPTLVLGLFAILMVPVVAVVAAVWRALSSLADLDDRGHHGASDRTQEPTSPTLGGLNGPTGAEWHHTALIEILGPPDRHYHGTALRYRMLQPVVQIGRSEDVDIIINDPTVHHYHAAIERTEDAEYHVMDLSAGTGNGVVVNGEPVLQRTIHHGDEIRLGRAKLRFLTAPT